MSPCCGEIRVDGVLLEESVFSSWRSQVSYVAQDPYLFNDSLRNNLLWAAPSASERQMLAVLEALSLDGVIQSAREGLDILIGEQGVRLSGGQRQRLCIAQALLRQPRLLILDEATNELDRQTEEKVLSTLSAWSPELTLMFVTHRFGPLELADQVFVLENRHLQLLG